MQRGAIIAALRFPQDSFGETPHSQGVSLARCLRETCVSLGLHHQCFEKGSNEERHLKVANNKLPTFVEKIAALHVVNFAQITTDTAPPLLPSRGQAHSKFPKSFFGKVSRNCSGKLEKVFPKLHQTTRNGRNLCVFLKTC